MLPFLICYRNFVFQVSIAVFRLSNRMNFAICSSKSFEHFFLDKHDYERNADKYVYADDNPESPQFALEGNARVHTPKRGYHSRSVNQKRENGERLHNDV